VRLVRSGGGRVATTLRARFFPLALLALLAASCAGAKPSVTASAPAPAGPAPGVASAEPASANAAPTAIHGKAQKIASVEGITEYRLDNGLQVLLFPDVTQSTVTVNITYLVGSRLEGYGETGMAHLLEHMLFKGSPRHRNVLKLLQERGGQANGSTWYDRTNYFETLPGSQENLDWTLDLEADRMIHASISPEDLKTEFSVVRNEFEGGENNPRKILDERVNQTAYLWHNYGKPTIGSRTDIERVPVSALRTFYEKYYQPDDAVLVVSGRFDEAAALASIERLFGAIAKPSRVLADSYTVEPQQDGERSVTLRRNGDVHIVELAYHTVGGASPDYPAVEAAIDVLTRDPSSRLYKKLVESKLATNLYGTNQPHRDPSIAAFSATVRDPKNVDRVEQTMIADVENLAAGKIDDRDVERWRTATLKDFDLAMANSQWIAIVLSESAALGDWRTLFAHRDRVRKVTTADVARVAKAFFRQSNRTVGRFVPTKEAERAPLVERPDTAAYVEGIEGGEVDERGEVFAATLDNIEARTRRKELQGGIKAALLPKKTRGGKVALALRLHWGDEQSLRGKRTLAALASAMLARGTVKKTYQEIRDLQDQLKAQVGISGGADEVTLYVDTVLDKLPAALDLATEMLTTPSFPDKEFDVVRQEQLAWREQQLQDPNAVAFATLRQLTTKWSKDDPRYPASPAEEIAEIKGAKLQDVRQFYREFAGAGHGELAVVGDFDADAISAQVEKVFASWQSKKPYTRLTSKPFLVPGGAKSVDIKDKEQTMIALGEDVAMRDTDPDYPAWLMVSQVLGGDTGSRAWMRLREHEGLSYGVSTWAYAGSIDDAGGFGGYAIVAPQNLAKAKSSLLDEIQRMAGAPITDDELRHAKEAWLKLQDTSLSNDNYVVWMLENQLYCGRTNAFLKDLRSKVAALTTTDVERVAARRLDPNRIFFVDAGDHAKEK
jgi:zinc protease